MAVTQITRRFRPYAVGTEDYWALKRGSSKVAAVDPGHPISHDDSGSFIQNATLSTNKQSFRIDRNFPEKMGTILQLRVHCRADPHINNASIKLGVALTAGPSWVLSATIDLGTGDWVDKSASLSRPGGGSWTENDLRDTTFQFSVEPDSAASPDIMGVTSLWVEVDYLPTDEGAGAIPPEFPSRKLRRSRLPACLMSAELRADALDIDLLEDFEVVHSEGPYPGGKGWGDKDWEARRFRCIESALDLNKMTVQLRAIDLRDYACMFWHTGISPYTIKSGEAYPDGPAILTPGSTETFTRLDEAWGQDADGLIAEFSDDIKIVGPDGVVMEGASTNYIVNSAFLNGWSGWTQTNPTRMSLDAGNLLFYDEVASRVGGTNQTAKLNYVNGAGDCAVDRNTAGSGFNGSEYVALSIWHKDSNPSYPARVQIQNVTSGKYYNASTQSWQAGAVINPLTVRTTWGRSKIVFLNDTSFGALNVKAYSPTSPGSDTYSHIGNVQVEWAPGGSRTATGPIPTYTAVVTRHQPSWRYSNNLGRRVWPAQGGTLIARCKFLWSSPHGVVVPGYDPKKGIPLVLCYHDSNNWAYLAKNIAGGPQEVLEFTIRAAGVNKTAYLTFAPVEETTYVLAARWTSFLEELDLPARTLSVFLDGVKGADIEHTADMIEAGTSEFCVGTPPTGGGFGFNSFIPEPGIVFSHIEVVPFPLTDEEIRARP